MTIILFSAGAIAQEYSLKGKSALEINFGLWGGAKTSNTATIMGIRSEATTSGFMGSILYTRWIQEQFSVTISAGFLAGEGSSTVRFLDAGQHASTVVPILIGVNYYFFDPSPDDGVRPFVSAAIGTYIGAEASNTILSQNAHSETAFGGRFGGGIDFLLSTHMKLGVNAGYNLMSEFPTPVDGRINYNGADVSIGIGYIF